MAVPSVMFPASASPQPVTHSIPNPNPLPLSRVHPGERDQLLSRRASVEFPELHSPVTATATPQHAPATSQAPSTSAQWDPSLAGQCKILPMTNLMLRLPPRCSIVLWIQYTQEETKPTSVVHLIHPSVLNN